MDVTKANFINIIPEITNRIEECNFLAIDCEFTGLTTHISNDYLHTQEEFYNKFRNNMNEFQIIQIGISTFKMVEERKFDCNSYNFYIFPSKCSLLPRDEKERFFLCQSSSLQFLIENGFDFNKLVREGISYLNLSQEKYVREKLNEKTSDNLQINSSEDTTFTDDIMKQIAEFVAGSEQELVLPPLNAYRRRLVYVSVQNSPYQNQLDLSTEKFPSNKIVVRKCTEEDKKKKNELFILENIGFTHIIKLIIKNEKPVVGHNLYLDLLYIYNAFIGSLPKKYSEFRTSIHTLFPSIFDTKFISSSGVLKNLIPDNSLNKLYESLKNDPFIKCEIILKNVDKINECRYHEAGFDSYHTGCCFVTLIHYLYAQEFESVDNIFSNDILSKYRNKISILRSYDIKYMDLECNETLPNRDHVFHVTFPSNWKRNDLTLLFNEFGGLSNVSFIDDSSAFCILKEPDNSARVVENLILKAKSTSLYKIRVYKDYNENRNISANNEQNGSTEVKRSKQKLEKTTNEERTKKIKKEHVSLAVSRNSGQSSKHNEKLFEELEWNP